MLLFVFSNLTSESRAMAEIGPTRRTRGAASKTGLVVVTVQEEFRTKTAERFFSPNQTSLIKPQKQASPGRIGAPGGSRAKVS
jgi:hypothetical protein